MPGVVGVAPMVSGGTVPSGAQLLQRLLSRDRRVAPI